MVRLFKKRIDDKRLPAGTEFDAVDINGEGKWVPAACWFNCGGRCHNAALVVDDTVVRQKSDDTHPDTPDYPQQRACLRGRSLRQVVFGPDRVKYPMKRKHWAPITGGDKSLRGKDQWERISWDEALDYVAAELKHAKEKYGNRSILVPHWGDQYSEFYEFFKAYGGFTSIYDTGSFGTYAYISRVLGLPIVDLGSANDRYDMRNSETIVLYGCNPAWASPGSPSHHFWLAKKAGAQFVFVGPEYNDTSDLLDVKWIRVRPGTDTAFLLSVAYMMLKEDDPVSNPLVDWEFLNRYTIGFDGDHMPADATIDENFKDYVLGKYDGQPKTPAWATEICGTPVEDIIWYAREMRRSKKVALLHSYAPARCNNADDFPQIYMTIGAMGGHMGKPGHACGAAYHFQAGNCGPPLVSSPPSFKPRIKNKVKDMIAAAELYDAILDGKYNNVSGLLFGNPPEKDKEIDIRVIYHHWRNSLQTIVGCNKGIEAHRKVDFVVTNNFQFNASAQYSDIVLPITTQWERNSDFQYRTAVNREAQLFPSRVVEPLYEARSEQWIGQELCKRLGLDEKEVFPLSEEQRYFNNIAKTKVINDSGEGYEKLATVTEDDIAEWGDKWGVTGSPQKGKIGLKELMEKGVYQVERHEGDNKGSIGYQEFITDPEKNPLPSKSGKFEIYCQAKADMINGMDRSKVKPYPTYVEPLNGYEQSFSNWGKKIKGKYPYQVFNPHYLRRAHTVFDNVPSLREAMTNPVFISSHDAKEKGVTDGDTVLVYNKYGKVLRQVSLSQRLMPGCISLPHGAWIDKDEKTGIDRAGSDNVLCAPETSGCGVTGYNTNLVNFEKYDGKPLKPDAAKPPKTAKV
jgi:anaerobic dimethyl sulfoxide reductase subunit A